MELFENILGSILKFFKNPILNDLNGNLLILDFNGWLYLVFIVLYVALIISLAFYFHKEEKLLEKPFNAKVGYKYLITIGFLGMHHFYLFQKKKAHVFWGIIFVFILINLHLFANIISFPQYTFDINSYSYFSRVLIILIIYYLIRDAILMHYYCYKQNNNIYRIHFDKDLIIGGKKNEIDMHLSKHKNILKKIDATIRYIEQTLDDKSIKDHSIAPVGFIKNVITLGKAKKLNEDISRLKALQNVAEDAQQSLNDIFKYHEDASKLLQISRFDAYRNLTLAKEMLSIIKKFKSKSNLSLIKDSNLIVEKVKFEEGDLNPLLEALENNSVLDIVHENFSKHSLKLLKSNSKINNEAILEAGVNFVVDAISDLTNQIINLNKDINKKRTEVTWAKFNLENSLVKSSKAAVAIKANILRINEVLKALNEVNKTFIKIYEPLKEKAFPSPNLSQYLKQKSLHKQLVSDKEFWEDVSLLIQYSAQYNKINQAKII